MDGMCRLTAPQWTVFRSNPEIPDDSFIDEHLELGTPMKEVVPTCPTTPGSVNNEDKPNVNFLIVLKSNDSLIKAMRVAQITPVKVLSQISKKNSENKAEAVSVLLEGQSPLDPTDHDNLMSGNNKMQCAVGIDISSAPSAEWADINTHSSIATSTIEAQPKSSSSSSVSTEASAKSVQKVSNVFQRLSGHGRAQQARVPTFQRCWQSLKQYHRRSNKLVSMAEEISKFQSGNPERFRSVSLKDPKPEPLQKLKIEEMKKNSLRYLARANSSKGLSQNSASKIIEKVPEKLPNFSQLLKMKTSNVSTTKSKSNHKARLKVTVPPVASTKESLALEDAEISHLGLPDITTTKQSVTKITHLSFEMRNKELQKRREQKIQQLLAEEEQKTRVTFHARPVPNFKKPMLIGSSQSVISKHNCKTKPNSFSF